MKNRKRGQKLVYVALLISAAFFLGSHLCGANMCQLISIESEKGAGSEKLIVYPEKITVPVGSCTVWMNWVVKGDVYVSFRENAKKCVDSSASPSGFNLQNLKDGESCYLSDKLSRGKTASLFWKQPGTFKYTIELKDSGKDPSQGGEGAPIATGTIEVK
jgi:hypothetical protein